MTLTLRFIPDPVLREIAKPVNAFDENIFIKAHEMLKIMYDANGVGLAGPQVGLNQRIVVMDLSDDRNEPMICINPKITSAAGKIKSEEGCLSIPTFRSTIMRSDKIAVEYFDIRGNKKTIEGDDLLSRCFQHEIDHLNGVLFTDYLKGLNKRLYQRWEKKFFEGVE